MDKIKFEAVDICCTKKDDLKIVSALMQFNYSIHIISVQEKRKKCANPDK